jgi:hypothetical protein
MSLNIGVNVIEVDGATAPSVQGALTSVAGFIIRSKRGLAGQVVRVTNMVEFVEHFGGHDDEMMGAYAVSGFFQNGGATAYVMRILPEPDDASSPSAPVEATGTFAVTFPPPEGGAEITVLPLAVTAAYRNEDDPGEWGNHLAIALEKTDAFDDASTLLNLVVHYPDARGDAVETWEGLDLVTEDGYRAAQTLIERRSKYIRLDASPASSTSTLTVGGDPQPLGGGSNGTFAEGEVSERAQNALDAFDTQPIQLLCCPETATIEFSEAAMTRCEELGDRMFVGHLPIGEEGSLDLDAAIEQDDGVGTLADYARSDSLRGAKRYGALYGPNVLVPDPLSTEPKSVPPTGHILGVYARTDMQRGIWKAPAGDGARLLGVLDVTDRVSDTTHTYFVKQLGINLVRPVVGKGLVVDSARTLSTDPRWLYVNVRLLFNFVKSSLKLGLRWVVGEPNDATLWGRVKHDSVEPFLMGLWRAGAFGSGTPGQSFNVVVDGTNNRADDVMAGRLNVDVAFYPSRPAETIVVRVGQQQGVSSAGEA